MNNASVSKPECQNGLLLHWKIRNYRMCALDRSGYIESPKIKMSDIFIKECKIKLHPWNKNDFNCLGLSIENKDMKQEISVDISVLTTEGKFALFKGVIDFKNNDIQYVSFKNLRHDDVIEGDSIFIVDDALTLCCHFSNYVGSYSLRTCSALTHIGAEKHIFNRFFYQINETSVGKNQVIISSIRIGKSYFDISLEFPSLYDNGRIYLHRKRNENPATGILKAKISVVCSDGNLRHTSENHELLYAGEMSCYFNLGFCLNQLLKDRNLYMVNDYIKLQFELITSSGKMLSYIEEYIKTNINKDAVEFKEILPQTIPSNPSTPAGCEKGFLSLKEDFKNLLKEKTLSDVVVRAGGREFPVHKTILSARSPVFRSMFESDMKEKRSGVVQIDDVDSETMDIFLKYLYVGSVDNLKWDTAVALYSTADKYQVASLKNECSSFLSSNLSEKNVCDVLILADMHQDAKLKKAAQKVFCAHSKNVLFSKEWINLMQNHINLATEILRLMATKM